MADNMSVKDAAGVTQVVASDEISSGGQTAKAQRVKLSVGADGSGNDWEGGVKDSGPDAGAGVMQTPFHGDASTAQFVCPAPTAGQKWVVTDIFLSASISAEVHLEEETSGTVIFGPVFMAAYTMAQFTPRGKLKLATANKRVLVHSSGADHITCQISGLSEA